MPCAQLIAALDCKLYIVVVCTSCLQEPPPDSQPPGDESDRLLLDALKAAAPGTELAVDEDEPIMAAVPADHAGGAADGDAAVAAVAVPQPEAVAGVRDAAGSAAEAASGGAAGAASVAVAPAGAAADEPMPEAAAAAVPAEPSLSEQTLIKRVTSPATVTGEQPPNANRCLLLAAAACCCLHASVESFLCLHRAGASVLQAASPASSYLGLLIELSSAADSLRGVLVLFCKVQRCKTQIPSCPARILPTAAPPVLRACRQAQQEGVLKQSSAGEMLQDALLAGVRGL
jgi:hypothetical protein